MKFSELWLRKFFHLNIKLKKICNQLTEIGFEVDNILPNKKYYKNIIIGRIIYSFINTIKNYFINIIDVGNNEYLEVKSFYIKNNVGNKILIKKKIFNIVYLKKNIFKNYFFKSKIYFYKILNINYYNINIIKFLNNYKVGMYIKNYTFIKDYLININIPANRVFSIGILGIVKELYAYNNKNFKIPITFNNYNISSTISNNIKLFICSKKKSIRYVGKIIQNVNLNISTPLWIKKKLNFCKISSSNIISDILNYIFIETGQIFHIFDLNTINDNIYVRLSKFKEKFITIKNKIYYLTKPYWVIADDKNILSLGVNGLSKFSKVNKKSNSIFIGSVNINTITNYKSELFENILKLNNLCFSKTVDYNLQEYIIDYATKLIIQICGGLSSNFIYNQYFKSFSNVVKIKLYIKKIYSLIGYYISKKIILNILKKLDYKIYILELYWLIIPSTARLDIKTEEDVINDFIRIYGCNKISSTPLFNINKIYKNNVMQDILFKMKNMLIIKGYYEVINYIFVDPKIQSFLFPKNKSITLKNPLSLDLSVLRISLLNGLIKNLCYNKNRQQDNIRLFESGLCFLKDKNSNLGIQQKFFFSGITYGNRIHRHWDFLEKKIDFYDLKGDLESIFELFTSYFSVTFSAPKKKNIFLHPGKSASILFSDIYKGYIGTLHPKFQEKFNLNSSVNIFEFVLDFDNINIKKKKISSISLYPISKRDIVIIVSKNILSGEIITLCKNISKENIIDVCIFDIYQGKFIKDNKKSIAIGLVFQNKKYTLKEYEIIFFVEKCIFALQKKFNAILRDK